MEKIVAFIKCNKIKLCLCWIVLCLAVAMAIVELILLEKMTILQMICIASIAICIYVVVVSIIIHVHTKKKLNCLMAISNKYKDFQISIEKSQIMAELPESQYEEIERYALIYNIKLNKISNHNGIIKVLI